MSEQIERDLRVLADGKETAAGCRLQLRARRAVGLYPIACMLDIWNLSDDGFSRLMYSRKLEVRLGENTLLAAGRIAEVYRRPARPAGLSAGEAKEQSLTTVVFAAGLELWESRVSLSLPGGVLARETVNALLAASCTDTRLLGWKGPDPVFVRGQTFYGRAAKAVEQVLGACGTEAVLVPAGLKLLGAKPAEGEPPIRLKAKDLEDAPYPAGDAVVVRTRPAGWLPGSWVECKEFGLRGVIRECSVLADNRSGPWYSEILVSVK